MDDSSSKPASVPLSSSASAARPAAKAPPFVGFSSGTNLGAVGGGYKVMLLAGGALLIIILGVLIALGGSSKKNKTTDLANAGTSGAGGTAADNALIVGGGVTGGAGGASGTGMTGGTSGTGMTGGASGTGMTGGASGTGVTGGALGTGATGGAGAGGLTGGPGGSSPGGGVTGGGLVGERPLPMGGDSRATGGTTATTGREHRNTTTGTSPASSGAYTIREGDTLWVIAKRTYGDARAVSAIVAANPGLNADRIRAGQKINLPPADSVRTARGSAGGTATHSTASVANRAGKSVVVREGETLFDIARRELGNGQKWDLIYHANRGVIRNPDVIHAGVKLVIPQS